MRTFLKHCLLILLFSQEYSVANCFGHFINPLEHICWSCLLPISIGNATMAKSSLPDPPNPKNPICACTFPKPRLGISIGFWEPHALVDVTHTPFCMSQLGGLQLNRDETYHYPHGSIGRDSAASRHAFYHAHWYRYPLLSLLGIITDLNCIDLPDFDLGWMSEFDPFWHDDDWAFLMAPESSLFANKAALLACTREAITLRQKNAKPIDKLFWCLGSHGSVYPLNGHIKTHTGGVRSSVLLSERLSYKLHRMGLLQDSDQHTLCHKRYRYLMPKSRYRYQMTYPVPQNIEPDGCRAFGHSTQTWEAGHEYPVKGEDFAYLIWRKVNCCAA